MKGSVKAIFDNLFIEHPDLSACKSDIRVAYDILKSVVMERKLILICGNGGSAADSEHIVGELMKGFNLTRELNDTDKGRIKEVFPDDSATLLHLQGAIPAVSLVSHTALSTAFINDVSADMTYAQQVYGYRGLAGALIGISTSGNAVNVINAVKIAKAFDLKAIGLTGESGGKMVALCDVTIKAPSSKVYRVQEYHLPIYHVLCAMLEQEFFG